MKGSSNTRELPYYTVLAFVFAHLALCGLVLTIPRAAADIPGFYPFAEKAIGERTVIVLCDWVVVQSLCVRLDVVAVVLSLATLLESVASYAILTLAVEYTYLALQGQNTHTIHDLVLGPSRQIVDRLLFALFTIAGISPEVDAVGSGQGGQGATEEGATDISTSISPPPYISAKDSQHLQASDKFSDMHLV
ncbi:hypothetical protein GGX14DRAFT_574842 [Mycena pura]|uniref:Uncharacterized protein n=1 Tax=Mycena pura TaxID=153505 RepID=A0AAD6Y4Q5_9AGAR|nr:hypothetical protein GGX14DRAFT_574842 [Mycena pura]